MVYKLIAKLIPWKYIWGKISKTMFFVKLKAKWLDGWLKKRPEQLDYKIKTVKANAFNKFTLSKEQQLDLENCKELEEIIIKWLHDPFNIETEALKVDYSQWQFTTVGFNFRKILVEVAATIKDVHYTSMTVSEKNLLNSQEHIVEKISNSLFENQEKIKKRLEDIKQDLYTNKVKTARIKILELRKLPSDNLSEETKINILELLLVCQLRLPYTVGENDRISTLYQLLESVTEVVRREKIQCLIQHTQQNHRAALTHINNAYHLSPEDPDINHYKFIMLCNAKNKHSASEFLININTEIIEKRKVNFAWCYYEINNLDKAEELLNSFHAESSPNIESCTLSAEIQMKRLYHAVNTEDMNNKISEQQLQELERRLDLVESNLCEEDERSVFIFNELHGIVLSERGELQEAAKRFEKSLSINANDNFVNWNLTELYGAIEAPEKALVQVDKLPDTFEKETKRLRFLIKTGQPETAVDRIAILLSKHDVTREQKVQLYELKVYALSKLMRAKEIQNIYNTLEHEYRDIQYSYKIRADIHKSRNGTEDHQAIECLRYGIAIDSKSDDAYIMRRIFFSLLFRSKKSEDINEAIEIGKQIFNPVQRDDGIFQYIKLLFDTRRYEECLSLVKQIGNSQGFVLEAKRVESIILYNKMEFTRCEEVCRDIIKQSHTEYETVKMLVDCLYRLSKYTEVTDMLEIAYSHLNKDVAFLQLGSEIYFKLYTQLDDQELLSYSLSYAKKYLEVDNYSKESVDCFISKLILCSADNTVTLDNKYSILGRELLNKYHDMFPASESLEIIDVLDDVEGFINKMKENLRERHESFESIFNIYSEGKLPLSFISTVTNKDYYRTWDVITHTPILKIWLTDTNIDDIEVKNAFLASKPKVVFTLHSLILLHSLGLLQQIRDICSLNISQSGYTALIMSISDVQRKAKNGSKMFVYHNNQPQLNETDAEVYKRELSFLEELSLFIEGNCKIIGHLDLEYDNVENTDLVDILGNESAEFIYSKNSEYIFYSDDLFIRHSSSAIKGRKNTYILPFLRFLLSNSRIERTMYDESIIKLVRWNYYIIPLELETIQYAIHKSSFTINEDVTACFNLLYDTYFDASYTVETLFHLTKWIWSECLIHSNRVILTDQILSILSARISKTEALTLFESNINFLVNRYNIGLQNELRNYIDHHKKFAIHTLK